MPPDRVGGERAKAAQATRVEHASGVFGVDKAESDVGAAASPQPGTWPVLAADYSATGNGTRRYIVLFRAVFRASARRPRACPGASLATRGSKGAPPSPGSLAGGFGVAGSVRLYLVGTFAFSSSNQFRIRLMCVTGGRGGAGRDSLT